MKVTKLFNTAPSSINDQDNTVTFTISDNKPDRMNESVDQKSWDFEEYKANPVVLWGHDPEAPENVLGTTESLAVSDDGSRTDATLKFSKANSRAQMVFDMIKEGVLKTVSVGFISGDQDRENDGTSVLRNNKLLEISVVPIPANPRAIALSYKASGISKKDARWLLDSMKREIDVLEKQLTDENVKEKAMSDEQLKQVMDAINAVKTDVEGVKTDVETNKTEQSQSLQALNDQVTALKPSEDAAKDGKTDQSGADGKLDLNTELTPEQEAAARTSLGLDESEDEAA